MTGIKVFGPVPLNPPGLPSAGQQGENIAQVDETTPEGAAYIACVLYAIGYRNVIPNPTPQPMIPNPVPDTNPPTPGYQSTIPDPAWQPTVPQTNSPGHELCLHLRTYMNNLAKQGAVAIDATAVAAVTVQASVAQAAVEAVNPVVQ